MRSDNIAVHQAVVKLNDTVFIFLATADTLVSARRGNSFF